MCLALSRYQLRSYPYLVKNLCLLGSIVRNIYELVFYSKILIDSAMVITICLKNTPCLRQVAKVCFL